MENHKYDKCTFVNHKYGVSIASMISHIASMAWSNMLIRKYEL